MTLRSCSPCLTKATLALTFVLAASSAIAQDVPPVAEEAPVAPDADAVPEDLETSQDQGANAPKLQQATPAGSGGVKGRGIALDADGNSRLHLRLDVGAGFDTNPYAVPFDLDAGEFPGDIVTRVRPGLELEYPGSLIAFDGAAFVDYGFLPNVFGGAANANWLLYQAAVRGTLDVNRGGMFNFAASNVFSSNNDAGVVALGTIFNRLRNDLGIGVGYRPGGGTLRFRLAYNFGFEKWFDPNFGFFGDVASPIVREGGFDQMSHGASLRADYRFLPKTGVFAEVGAAWNTYPFDRNDINPDSFPVGIRIGIMGQMTPKLSGLVSIGYQNPLIVDTVTGGNVGIASATIIGVAGQAELRWAITPTTRLAGGLNREIRPAPLYQYLENNRVYVRFDQAIGAKFVLGVFAGFSLLQFGQEQPVVIDGNAQTITDNPNLARLDAHTDVGARLSYFMLDWLSFGINNNLDWRATNAVSGGLNLSYLSNETMVLATLHY